MIFRYLVIFILNILLTKFLFAQSNILNPGFESNGLGTNCPDGAGELMTKTFNNGNVLNWQASHGSPQLNNKTASSCDALLKDVNKGNYCAFMAYGGNHHEGIFQNINLTKGAVLNLELFAKSKGSSSTIVVKFCSGLANESTGNAYPINSLPSPTISQTIVNTNITSEWQSLKVGPIVLDDDFDQIWIYPVGNGILVDDISLGTNCCELFKIYQNIVNPPSTYVNDYILAGRNVTSNVPQGDVVITNSDIWFPTIFQAKNEIILEPGFITSTGSNFVAKILPCDQTPINLELNKISGADNPCEFEYLGSPCFGSGFFSYTWNLGTMTQLDGNNLNGNKVKFLPKNGQTLSLTVVDQVTNVSTTKSLLLAGLPFIDPITSNHIAISNVITPNNDGINDNWFATDLTNPGTIIHAHNSYRVAFYTFVEESQREFCIYEQDKTDKIYGVWDKFVFRNGSDLCQCILDDVGNYGWLFYETLFKNCVDEKHIEGAILVDCDYSEPIELNMVGRVNKLDEIFIFPNPTDGKLQIHLHENDLNPEYQLFDIQGRKMREGTFEGEHTIDISNCPSGIYVLKIKNNTAAYNFKIIRS